MFLVLLSWYFSEDSSKGSFCCRFAAVAGICCGGGAGQRSEVKEDRSVAFEGRTLMLWLRMLASKNVKKIKIKN